MNIEVKKGIYVKNGEEHEFEFKTNLKSEDKIKFINGITDIIIGDNYHSIIKDLIFDYMIIKIFTNIDVYNIDNSPDFLSNIENLFDDTNIVEIVKVNAVKGLIGELRKAVDKNIEFKTGIHEESLADNLSNLVKTITSKIAGLDMESVINTAD